LKRSVGEHLQVLPRVVAPEEDRTGGPVGEADGEGEANEAGLITKDLNELSALSC